jgi:hypothetical protein
MKTIKVALIIVLFLLPIILTSCSTAPEIKVTYAPSDLHFDKTKAFMLQSEFAQQFIYRSSGQPNSILAVEWIFQTMVSYGWVCDIDEWSEVNYNKPITLQNVVCALPGKSSREILVVAHHDQAPTTVEGADNDASGIAILMQLAEVFGSEGKKPYTLVFVATDAEEYGMLGTRHYLQTHLKLKEIIAGISLDNLGKSFANGIRMEPTGQFHNYGQIWLQLLAQEAASAADDLWIPKLRSPMDQVLDQAVPIAEMDQGPMVAAGIPALGFDKTIPAQYINLNWEQYHTPADTMEFQSAETLYHTGQVTEALIRQLLAMTSFPSQPGPYVYLEANHQIFRGAPLWIVFSLFVALFFIGSIFSGGLHFKEKVSQWPPVILHFLSLWLPLVASILLLYLFVAVGLMDKYAVYPATPKDPAMVSPHWPAVILFLLSLVVLLGLSRWLLQHFSHFEVHIASGIIKSFAMLVTGLAAVYVLLTNPFSLLFFVPLHLWLLIKGRSGIGKALDIVLFILGGMIVYLLFYVMGFLVQHINFAVLWYILMMFSIREITVLTALAITAIIAAGLSMIVKLPVKS